MTQKFLGYAYRINFSGITTYLILSRRLINSRLYFLSQLKCSGLKRKELQLLFYLTCIRPYTEYPCPVYHDSLPQYLHSDIKRCPKHALRIIFLQCLHQEALGKAGIVTLYEHRENTVVKLFKEVCNDPHH